VPGATWAWASGRLTLDWNGPHRVEAVPRPSPAQRSDARRLQGAGGRAGWFQPATAQLWIDLGERRWLQVDSLTEAQAFRLLDLLESAGGTASQAA